MTRIWKKLSQEAIKSRVFNALERNIDYTNEHALGVPASLLDGNVFNQDASFLKEAPFLSTMIQNPNHIGCHTLGNSESFFAGTQEIERELIDICAVDILKGEKGEFDGYVASGGTVSVISRDNFVSISTMMFVMVIESMAQGQEHDIQDLDEIIGNADIEINLYMAKQGMQFEMKANGEVFRETMTWDEL